MIKVENKKLNLIALIATIIFVVITINILAINANNAKKVKYLGINSTGKIITLKSTDTRHA